jgi:alkylation response protein AidB-like acyl-CoA dehydrogenase
MTSSTHVDGIALRQELLARVDGIRDVLADTAQASQTARELVPEAVNALNEAGLMRMNVPSELGGWEAAPATQMEVLAALAGIDTAAGWIAMVSNNSAGFMGAFLPDAGVDEVFAGGTVPICSGVAAPSGTATEVDGGFALTGYWRLCSGVHHSSWLRLTAAVDGNAEHRVFAVVPQSAVEIHDTWHVLGLRATGSCDVSLAGEFVPAHRTLFSERRRRGGARYRLHGLPASSHEHVGIALGLGRRALDELAAAVGAKTRTRGVPAREVVLTELGRLTVALESVTALAQRSYARDLALLEDDGIDAGTVGLEGPALAAYATDVATECIETAYRCAGTLALYEPNVFERLLRDIHGATQHVMVQDVNYAQLGARRIAAAGAAD